MTSARRMPSLKTKSRQELPLESNLDDLNEARDGLDRASNVNKEASFQPPKEETKPTGRTPPRRRIQIPKKTTKREETQREEPKKEETQREEPQREEPKKEETQREEPKKEEETQKEEPKKEETEKGRKPEIIPIAEKSPATLETLKLPSTTTKIGRGIQAKEPVKYPPVTEEKEKTPSPARTSPVKKGPGRPPKSPSLSPRGPGQEPAQLEIDQERLEASIGKKTKNANVYTVPELKDFARQLGVSVTGKKQDLINRIKEKMGWD